MNSILPGTIEEPGLDKYKVGTQEAPSGGAWFVLEAVLFTCIGWTGAASLRPIGCGHKSSTSLMRQPHGAAR